MNLINLKKKIMRYDIIIFDLDNTIYSKKNYDDAAIFYISKFISKNTDLTLPSIFSELIKIKNQKKTQLLFNIFFKNKKVNCKKKIILKCVSLFQNFQCKNLKKCKSLKLLIKNLFRHKLLFLVTNGNLNRQKNKIKYLGIKKYFKKIFILDDIKKKAKPSVKDVKFLVRFIRKHKDLKTTYVGDDLNTDKKFAKNLKIDYIFFKFYHI